MNQVQNNRTGAFGGLLGRLGADKKKSVTALGLIGVMVFMWIKVLTSGGPSGAEAALSVEQPSAEQSQQQMSISYVEMPQVEGRNDKLSRDFFAVDHWQKFIGNRRQAAAGGVDVVSQEGSERLAKVVGGKLKLQAIELGRRPLAFINDKLLAVGDKMVVSDGIEKYECEVAEIEGSKVLIRCGKAEIVLKLSHQIELAD